MSKPDPYLSLLTPAERRAVRLRMASRVLVWCWSCGASYDWPWGHCVYQCEHCGSHRMTAFDPTPPRTPR